MALILALPQIGLAPVDLISLLRTHPAMIHEVAGHALAHALYSYIRRHRRPVAALSLSARRRIINRKRRQFVDNIIMHHKRLHDKNRELVVSQSRAKIMQNQALKKTDEALHHNRQAAPEQHKWTEKQDLKQRALALRGRVDTRKLRARSRWISVQTAEAEG